MNKKIIILILCVILVLAGVATLLFLAVQKQKQSKQPVVTAPQIKKVLDEPIISPIASLDGSAIWYFNAEGRLFRVANDGTGLSEFPLPSMSNKINNVMWPKSGSDFIAISGSGVDQVKNYYDSSKKVYVNLPNNIQSLDWLPDSKRVVYIWKSSDNIHQQLVLANADSTGFQNIKDVFWSDLVLKAGSDNKSVLMYRQDFEGDTNKIYLADLETKEISTIISSGKNTGALWLPGTNRFLFTQRDITAYPKVYLYDFTNKQATDLNLSTSLEKIIFDNEGKTLYAAVSKKDRSGDLFVKIDLSTLKQETILEPDQSVYVRSLLWVGDNLYFVNNTDGKLYMISK